MTIKKIDKDWLMFPEAAAAYIAGQEMADVVNGIREYTTQQGQHSPIPQLDFTGNVTPQFTLASGTPSVLQVEVCPYNNKKGLHIKGTGPLIIDLPELAGMEFNNQAFMMTYDEKKNYQQSPQFRAYSTADNFWGYSCVLTVASINNGDTTGGSGQRIFNDSFRSSNGSPPATGGFNLFKASIVLGSAIEYDIWIFCVALQPIRKSRICVVWDDGVKSALTLGYSTLAQYGIKKQTVALIQPNIDSGNYDTIGQLKSFINNGGAVVSHGAHSPNMVDQFPNDPLGAAEYVKGTMNWIRDLGLDTPRFDRCLVYAQGKYQATQFDTSYLDALRGIGIDIARISFMQPIRSQRNFDAHSRVGRLACTTIGHEYAGSLSAENTNIADVITRINECATYGVDAFVMLHYVCKQNGQEENQYFISVPNLKLIGAAIKAQVDAGKMETVTMPELVIDGDNYWNQF